MKKAIESGFTTPVYVWGVDIDENVKKKWLEINLLKSFGSKAKLDFHFYHQDGLLPIPEKKVGHKKDGMNQYNAVVGNPPYGGIGFSSFKEKKTTKEKIEILEHLRRFDILFFKKRKSYKETQAPLWGTAPWGTMPWGGLVICQA